MKTLTKKENYLQWIEEHIQNDELIEADILLRDLEQTKNRLEIWKEVSILRKRINFLFNTQDVFSFIWEKTCKLNN